MMKKDMVMVIDGTKKMMAEGEMMDMQGHMTDANGKMMMDDKMVSK